MKKAEDLKILYLGYFCTEELFLELSRTDKDFSIAAHKYETQLLSNLSKSVKPSNVKVVSILSYMEETTVRRTTDSFCGMDLQYVWKKRGGTIPSLSAFKEIKKRVKQWLRDTKGEERIVLTYATNFILLYPFLFRKKKVKIVTICSEIPQYRILTGGKLQRWIKKTINTMLNNRMDGYVFFSKYMNEKTNPRKKPYIVVEGLPDIRITEEEINQNERKEQIFYAGYLIPENGMETLLEAFVQMRHTNVELVLCGSGNMLERLQEYTQKCDRIKYLGSLPNDEILRMEREATLLINPRKADHLLTRYSFPSKTFEYFSSGTPAVLTRLEGIPEEYYQYCYTCDATDAESLASDLDAVLDIPFAIRLEKAKKAFRFVKEKKSAAVQTQRIVDFLNEVK